MPSSTVAGAGFFGVDGNKDSGEGRGYTSHENEWVPNDERKLGREKRLTSEVDHPDSTCFPFCDDLGASGAWRMLGDVGG